MSGFNGSQATGGNGFNGQFTAPSSEGGMQSAGDHQKSTLWMGELEPWMDENFVAGVFRSLTNEQVQVKVIRDKASGNAGYCFVEFPTHESATTALHNLQGQSIPNSSRTFRLNWASGGGINDRRDDRAPEYSIFVGDLESSINEYILVNLFNSKYPSCKSAKIMMDDQCGQSRGYGFVRFSNEADQQRALVEMQGVYCGTRPMRISVATPKNRNHFHGGNHGGMVPPHMHPGAQQMWGSPMGPAPYQQQFAPPPFGLQMTQFTDPNNTTVFVGGLSGYVTEDELRSFFQGFGEITYVKIPSGKGCGFVQFVHRHAAEMAINQMQGYPIGNSRVRLSWGRSQNNSGIGTPYRPAPPPPHYAPGHHNGPLGAGAPYPPGPGPNAQFQGPNMSGPYAGSPGQAPPFGPQGHHAGQSQSPSLQQGNGGPGAQGFGGSAAGQVSSAQQ